ncbi:MAG: hypothetical protein V4850_36865 [Myxococcota bacterium]
MHNASQLAPNTVSQVVLPPTVGAKRAGGGLVSVLGALVLAVLHGCGEPSACTATGGDWNDCAVVQAWCIDGAVFNELESPAICEQGCTCDSDAPVWDAAAGCITEASCVGAAPTDGS